MQGLIRRDILLLFSYDTMGRPLAVKLLQEGLNKVSANFAGAAVDSFATGLFAQGEHVETCNMLQDRINMLLTTGHAAVLGACGQGARVHLLPERATDSQVKPNVRNRSLILC